MIRQRSFRSARRGDIYKIDRTQINENGILVEGVVYVQILYVAADDKVPVNSMKGMVPFSSQIEIPDMDDTCTYEIAPGAGAGQLNDAGQRGNRGKNAAGFICHCI